MERITKNSGERESVKRNRVVQGRLSSAIDSSPMMAAQRKKLQGLFGGAVQLKAEEEPLQGKFEAVQRVEEEEPLQGKFEAVQRVEEEEPLQGKFETAQRVEEEEPLQGKFDAASSVQLKEEAAKPNNTGLPDNLKSGIESLSGMSIDNVKVHYNSSQPAQLNAHAYAQGTDIHVAPGQEQHLPHEAWHVVQQAQGRVKPTMQLKEGVPVNDDKSLEHEADAMGAKALQLVQRRADIGIARTTSGAGVAQRVMIAGVNVIASGSMPQWVMDGLTYHLNTTTDPSHVTCEDWPVTKNKKKSTTKMHFFFKMKNDQIVNAVSGQRGKKKFDDLPLNVQNFVRNNYMNILGVV